MSLRIRCLSFIESACGPVSLSQFCQLWGIVEVKYFESIAFVERATANIELFCTPSFEAKNKVCFSLIALLEQ